MKLIPAVLTDDADQLRPMLRLAESFSDYIQVDFMDGRFVPSSSITPSELANAKPRLAIEAHLMAYDPEDYFPILKDTVEKVVFHFEAVSDPLIPLKKAREAGFQASLALNPETDADQALPLIDKFDSVLLLGVHPGFYGQKFIPEVLAKIGEIKKVYPGLSVGVDGGVKLENIARIKQSGADFVCVGSAIFGNDDPEAAFAKFSLAVDG